MADACVKFRVGLIEKAVLRDGPAFITALLDLDPAVLRSRVPPPSQAIESAFTYAKSQLLPLLLRIWHLPDDLPYAAGNGDFALVRRWFDAVGRPVLGDLSNHFPANSAYTRRNLQWGEPSVQQVLDTALDWAVLNNQFEIADFLPRRGADINTNRGSHEPASILHELVFHVNYEAMQFLIDRGIDRTIVDHRWGSTAEGGAFYARKRVNQQAAFFGCTGIGEWKGAQVWRTCHGGWDVVSGGRKPSPNRNVFLLPSSCSRH